MICKFYKKKLSITETRELIGTTQYGTSVLGIKKGAEKLGFNVKAIRVFIENFDKTLTLPAIAQVNTEYGTDHFVVLYKMNSKQMIVADPELGVITYSYKQFEDIFSGILILMLPLENFESKAKNEEKIQLHSFVISIFLREKRILLTIFLATFLTTCFGIITGFFSKLIYDEVIPYSIKNSLYIYFIVMFLIYFARSILDFFKQYMVNYISLKAKIPLISGFFKHIIKLPYTFFTYRKSGDILTRFQDVEIVGSIYTKIAVSLLLDFFLSLLTATILFMVNKELFFILMFVVILSIILVFAIENHFKKRN